MRLKIGFESAKSMNVYESLVLVAGAMFGGEKSRPSQPKTKPVQNINDAVSSLTAMFGADCLGGTLPDGIRQRQY